MSTLRVPMFGLVARWHGANGPEISHTLEPSPAGWSTPPDVPDIAALIDASMATAIKRAAVKTRRLD